MMTDLFFIFNWWFLLLIIGFIFFPLTIRIFPSFIDKGYIFSKILALAGFSYIMFLFGTLHLIPFTRINLIFLLIGFFVVIFLKFVFSKKNRWFLRKDFVSLVKEKWKIILFEEVLFLIALLFWAYIKSFQPDIRGLEKFMDFGFINSILRTEYFPALLTRKFTTSTLIASQIENIN